MSGLHLARVALGMTVRVPPHVYERHLPSSPEVVGDRLADEVHAYVVREGLGYYPALDYFEQQGGVDPELVEAANHIAWFTSKVVTEEINRKLRPIFSNVSFQTVQPVAFTMPTARLSQPNALDQLAVHYTPNAVKLSVVVSSFHKRENLDGMGRWAKHLAYRWLKDSFEAMDVTSAEQLE